MGIRLDMRAGQAGKRLKALYDSRYGETAATNLPKRDTIYGGKPFKENVYFARGHGLMERAINDVAQ
ncbi:unnamed protein product, partial [Ascophyllum nodosum]